MLMVIYLTGIGYHDKMYEGEYFAHAREWESSYLCTLIGVTAVISSEVRTVFYIQVKKKKINNPIVKI